MVIFTLNFLTQIKNSNINIKLRLVEEKDIPVLYDMLKEMLETPNSSVNERPLPKFEDSKEYVMKYLKKNKDHEIDSWYMVIGENNEILGSVKISKKNYISYQILKNFQNKGLASKAIQMLMEAHPRDRYFAIINQENEYSVKLAEKFGFVPKAFVFEKVVEK